MKYLILSFSLLLGIAFAQDYEDISLDSDKEKDTLKKKTYLNPDINFTIGIGPSYSQMANLAHIGPKMHFKFLLGETKRHRLGLDANVMFGLNRVEGDTMTYTKFSDTLTTNVGYKFIFVNWNLAYDFYILPPLIQGIAWRVGLAGGIDIQSVDYDPGPFIFSGIYIGYRADFITGIEYRFANNFGLYGEISAGYHSIHKDIPAIRNRNSFIIAVTAGISWDFRLKLFGRLR